MLFFNERFLWFFLHKLIYPLLQCLRMALHVPIYNYVTDLTDMTGLGADGADNNAEETNTQIRSNEQNLRKERFFF